MIIDYIFFPMDERSGSLISKRAHSQGCADIIYNNTAQRTARKNVPGFMHYTHTHAQSEKERASLDVKIFSPDFCIGKRIGKHLIGILSSSALLTSRQQIIICMYKLTLGHQYYLSELSVSPNEGGLKKTLL